MNVASRKRVSASGIRQAFIQLSTPGRAERLANLESYT
jgi:hypothetical protein